MAKIALLTDSPIGEGGQQRKDGLGFRTYANVLANAADGTEGPFTIGVFGEWGTGKTSLMRMIKDELHTRRDVLTVWFNAWRYEQDDHPIVPLIATIIRELERKENKEIIGKLRSKRKNFLQVLRAVAYGFSVKSKVKVPGLAEVEASFVAKDMIERESELNRDALLDKSLYYEAFERLEKIKISGKFKIVVLVDDLDRCFPNKAVKLLESMKLVLCQPGFVFVLGVARSALQGYLEKLHREEYGSSFEGNEYLDKIVQLPFHIPPHWGRIGSFLECVLGEVEEPDRGLIQEIGPVIKIACGSNPRATIRFVNNILIDRAINLSLAEQKLMDEIPIGYFVVTRGLQQRWNSIFKMLESSDEVCTTVYKWIVEKAHGLYDAKDEDERMLAKTIDSDKNFRDLLSSEQGRNWLKDISFRRKATQFLQEQRPSEEEKSEEKGRVRTTEEGRFEMGALPHYLKRLRDLEKTLGNDVEGSKV